MPRHLVRKLEQVTKLSSEDKAALRAAAGRRRRDFDARADVVREGDGPAGVHLILDGWACRYKQLEDGRRQLLAFLLPGDLCDPHVFVLRERDHSIGALTPVILAEIPHATMTALTDAHPRIARALWWEMLVSAAIQREWTVSLGRRTALERVSHLLCELFVRLRGVGLTNGSACVLPVTQADLADATGLSSVHVNRTLQELRARDLVVLRGRELVIPDLGALERVGLFNPNYLHLGRIGPLLDANDG